MAKLTAKGIDGLRCPPNKNREYINDGGTGSAQGLCLLVLATGTKSWVWRSRLDGKQVKRTIGRYPALGLADARERANEFNRARDGGVDLAAQEAAERAAAKVEQEREEAEASKTLQWFWDDHYCPRFIPNKKGNETARLIEKPLLPSCGAKPLATITFDDLDDAIAMLAESAPKSADPFVVNIKTLFKRAKREFRRETV